MLYRKLQQSIYVLKGCCGPNIAKEGPTRKLYSVTIESLILTIVILKEEKTEFSHPLMLGRR